MRPPLVISRSRARWSWVMSAIPPRSFPLLAAGLEVAAVPTVVFSNTPDYPTLRGRAMPADFFARTSARPVGTGPARARDVLLTGYIGSVEVARLVAPRISRPRQGGQSAPALFCDPVMGDDGPGLYVPEAIAGVLKDGLLPLADYASPNPFEIGWLTGQPIRDLTDLSPRHARCGWRPVGI